VANRRVMIGCMYAPLSLLAAVPAQAWATADTEAR
jgi:hypothetical protein